LAAFGLAVKLERRDPFTENGRPRPTGERVRSVSHVDAR
jgi:hypothetical protein